MRIRIKKVPPQNGLKVANDQYKTLSSDGVNLLGKSHKKGGTYVSSNGEVVEAESGEPIYTDSSGNNVVFGNVKNPSTKTKFKNEAKELLTKKGKSEKKQYQANEVIEEADPYSRLGSLEFNSATVNLDASAIEQRDLKANLDTLASVQQAILSTAEQTNMDPNKLSQKLQKSGGTVKVKIKGAPTMQDGGYIASEETISFLERPIATPSQTVPNLFNRNSVNIPDYTLAPVQPRTTVGDRSYVRQSVEQAAINEGVDPNILLSLTQTESGFLPGVAGVETRYGTAYSHAQFLPSTAKQYGITEAQLKSVNTADIDAVSAAQAKHFKELQDKYGGDVKKALIAYNGGDGALSKMASYSGWDEVVGKSASEATGDDYLRYMEWRRQNKPTNSKAAYQNQTYNYVNKITSASGFENSSVPGYPNYPNYTGQPSTTPPERVDIQPITSERTPTFEVSAPRANVEPISQERISEAARAQPTPTQEVAPLERTRLSPMNFLGEMAALFDQPDFVQGQQYNPNLMQPYRVSFQDRINQNTANFNALSKNFADNPEALATLAGQKYQQDQQILAEEFRVNQGIQNQVANQNTEILNQAALTNVNLSDQQYVRQAQAEAVTDQNRINALNSISNKYAQNELYNQSREDLQRRRNIQSTMHQNYAFDQQGNMNFNNTGDYHWYNNGVQSVMPVTPQQASTKSQIEAAKKAAQAAFGHKFKKK